MSLIPITKSADGIQTVNARELHEFLEVKSEFRNWIKSRIEDFGFVGGSDFITTVEKNRGGERKDYHITLDMAKELSMVERSDKGKRARKYFIECERQLKLSFELPATFAEALRLAADQAEVISGQAKQIAEAAPKVEFHDAVTASDKVVRMAVAAQVAKLPFGQNTLFKKLRELGVLISGGTRHNLPKQKYIEQGLFTVDEFKFERSSGDPDVSFTTHVTQRGIAWIVKTFSEQGGQAA